MKFGPIEIEVHDLPDKETCRRKIRYGRECTAHQALSSMNMRGTPRKPLEVYACRFCDGWHLGRKRTKTRRVVAWLLERLQP